MTKKQKTIIALMCVVASILAALMLWRQPLPPAQQARADAHGHDDRDSEEPATRTAGEEEGVLAMNEAQVQANGIGLDTVRPAGIRERLHLPAQVKVDAERSVAIAAPAQGMVQSVLASPGAVVRKGQGLLVLQSPEVAQWRAGYAIAAQRVKLAQTVYQRERKLWEEGISARQDLDSAQTALREAEIDAQATRQRLSALGIASSGDASFSAVTVRAPLAGVVLERPAVAGMAIEAGKPLALVADLSRVWIEAAVPSERLGQVASGMPANVSAATLAQQVAGTVSFVGPVLGESTRMATARIALPNPGLRLRPGMLASVDLLGPRVEAALTVASEAVQTIHERSVVFVRTPTGFKAQAVSLGRTDGKRTEILQGLASGASYAAVNSYLLKADLGKSEAGHED